MAKAKKITTTIRWEGADLEEVKSAAHRIGLPVALFVKSIVLKTEYSDSFSREYG